MLALGSGLLTLLLTNVRESGATEFQHSIWREMFTLDVVAPAFNISTAADNEFDCARHCHLQLDDCKTSAFHQHSATCWLYRHLVEYGNTGTPSLGTRYFWRLSPSCAGELGYQLEAGICLKVYLSPQNRTQAETTCRNDGGHLAITDTAEKVAAARTKAPSQRVCLGGSDVTKEGDWRWLDGSHVPMTRPPWDGTQPDNGHGGENYLEIRIYTSLLNDNLPSRLCAVACQIPLQ